jgi:hypothetical protein
LGDGVTSLKAALDGDFDWGGGLLVADEVSETNDFVVDHL